MDVNHNPNDFICLFGAASDRIDTKYAVTVRELGEKLAAAGFSLVFGGGDEGLMGAAARGFEARGGKIIGVTPSSIDGKQKRFHDMDFILTESISERIDVMEALSWAFVVVPGGIGTLDELFYALSRNVVKELGDPICILNIDGFYDKLLELLDDMYQQGFIAKTHDHHLAVFNDVDSLVSYLVENRPQD